MKKLYIWIGAALLLIICVIAMKKCSGGGAIKVAVEKAQRRNIIETVSANGKVQPEISVKISPDVSGEIVELHVKEGQHVEKGDLLLKIKPDLYVAAVDRMNASLNSMKANLENSKARLAQTKAQFVNTESSYNRNKKLFEQNAISQAEMDAAKAQYEAAKADIEAMEKTVAASEYNVKSSEASLHEASDNLKKTEIFAPVSGTISKLNVELGERVVGTSQMAGTEMLTIANLNEMEVRIDVNENDIVRVHMGDTSLIEVDAYLDRKFKGIVTEIANSATTTGVTSDQVTNFTVKVRILQESYQDLIGPIASKGNSPFRPGMSATVDIQTKKVNNVVSVPIQAVTTRADSSARKMDDDKEVDKIVVKNANEDKKMAQKKEDKPEECVFVYDNTTSKVKLVKVKTGVQDNNFIEVVEGVAESDEVVSAPYGTISKVLRDKSSVKKVDKKDLYTVSEK